MNTVYGGGTLLGLCESLRLNISEALKSISLETENQGAPLKAPQIVNGYLPPKKRDGEPEFPFVIVRPKEWVTKDSSKTALIRIIIGTYSEDSDGHEYACIVAQRIEQSIIENSTLNERYTLEYPLKFELFDDQPVPFWQIVGVAQYTIPSIIKPREDYL